jgi:hypothetical protein
MANTNLYRIGQWFANRGLVGERRLALVSTVVAVLGRAIGFGIESPAGSGKTVVMDILLGDKGKDNGLIKPEFVYYKDAGSATSFWYDMDLINRAKIIVFKELQKDKSEDTVEAIKSITEGKSARRNVTDVTTSSVKEQKIDAKVVMYTLAIENDTKPDPELRRRCITMSTDISQDQTQEVLKLKAQLRWNKAAARALSDEEAAAIREDVNSLIRYKIDTLNPFAPAFVGEIAKISPDQKVRSMAEHFWDVVDGVIKINMLDGNHITILNNGVTTTVANIQDLLQAIDIYKESFVRDVFSIPPIGDVVLQGFADAATVESSTKTAEEEEAMDGNVGLAKFGAVKYESASDWYDINHVRKAIKEKQHIILSKLVVVQICKQLVDAGYLEDNLFGKTVKYQVQEKMKHLATPNVVELIAAADALVAAKLDSAKLAQWRAAQQLNYIHPLTGEEIKIGNSTSNK